MTRAWLLAERLRLERQRALMRDYLAMRLELEDWHGVQDAASDIREIDARLAQLRDADRV